MYFAEGHCVTCGRQPRKLLIMKFRRIMVHCFVSPDVS